MNEFSVPMALTDFIPVVLFGIAAVILQRDLYNKMPKYAFACLAAGSIDAFIAGFLKALWKLLYAAGICDFQVLNTMFLPTQSLGLLLTGLSLVLMHTSAKGTAAAALFIVPPVFKGTFVFVGMMVAGLGAICASLSILAVRLKKKALVPLFVLCFFCYMGMGYLASQDGNTALMNWIEQGVNTLGQLLLLAGVVTLHKARLRQMNALPRS